MKRMPRPMCALLIAATIITGLLSRRFGGVPLFIGDILWASLVYFLFRFAFTSAALKPIILISLLFCFTVEMSQLYTAPWLEQLRATLFGKLVLGSTFVWSDLLWYSAGVAIGAGIEMLYVAIRRVYSTSPPY